MYSYILLANGTKNKPEIVKNINEIAKSIFGHFLLVNTLFIQQLADISRYLELLHQLLSACHLFIFGCLLQLLQSCICYNRRIFTFPGLRIQTCGLSYIFQFVIWLMNATSVINSTLCPSVPIWYFRYSLQQHSPLVLLLTKSISDRIMDISFLGA